MARLSHILMNLGDDAPEIPNPKGTPIKAAGYFGRSSGIYTTSFDLFDFEGNIQIEGSLATDPKDADFFAIQLDGQSELFVEFPQNPSNPTSPTGTGDRGLVAFNFEGNFVWIRATVDRSFFSIPEDPIHGTVQKILVNF